MRQTADDGEILRRLRNASGDFDEEVVGFEAGSFGGGIGEDGEDHEALLALKFELAGDGGRDVFDGNAEPVLGFNFRLGERRQRFEWSNISEAVTLQVWKL